MYKPSENNKFGFESTEEDYDSKGKQFRPLSLADYYRIFDEYERALRNLERLMYAADSFDKRLEALELCGGSPHLDRLEELEKTKHRKTSEFNVFIPNETPTACADGWRDLFRERPGFYEWVEVEAFEGGRFKAFRADTNGNGDAWRDAELKPVSPPIRWRPLPSQKKARRDDE